jgi:G3E family GTPase
MLSDSGMDVREVAGSCFCCNFGELMDAAGSLMDRGADTILAEPVGSCTDLSATIMQPLHDSALYILRLQMAESDILLLNKIDLLSEYERAASVGLLRDAFPGKELAQISARAGDGVDAWLIRILRGGAAGKHIVDVDYDRYAEGEAVLGWLMPRFSSDQWKEMSISSRSRFG